MTIQPHLSFWGHVARLVFDTFTDLALIPAVLVVARRGRHFELFVGVFQLLVSLM